MKQLILFCTTLFSCIAATTAAQTKFLPNVEEKQHDFPLYQGIVHVDSLGLTPGQIYDGIKLWVAETYNSAMDVIQLDDRNSGIMIVKGNFTCTYQAIFSKATLRAITSLKFEIKENRFRYTVEVTDVLNEYDKSSMWRTMERNPGNRAVQSAKESIGDHITITINSIIYAMEKYTADTDW